ncbi:outer spore coat protein CotE [Saliterribacillus persicus]|uniref:Spore coat protein E n=1 Tax=Saliterribacillus persicus TaxID=930114 RepID=A0A368XRR2_9BACI|nr:outer spore coat protein CotE [Saliterribacillus persicus]RCW70642.1 spore coat protein E [Saliterribacillus persicus]
MAFFDQDYREIITKAVIGKGRKFIRDTNTMTPPQRPTSILGCWIINHHYKAKLQCEDVVEIHGSYEVNIWFSYNHNTKTQVVTEKVEYTDEIPLSVRDEQSFGNETEVIAKVLQQPNCLECNITTEGHKIKVEVEREFLVEAVGETKLCVRIDPSCESCEDSWEWPVSDDELSSIEPKHKSKGHEERV